MPLLESFLKSVLVVDDDTDTREELISLLVDSGFAARGAGSAAEAVDQMSEGQPDLVLLDMVLPDRPGDHVLNWMSTHERMRSVPVFIVTASGKRPATNIPVFRKPLCADNLLVAARAILDK